MRYRVLITSLDLLASWDIQYRIEIMLQYLSSSKYYLDDFFIVRETLRYELSLWFSADCCASHEFPNALSCARNKLSYVVAVHLFKMYRRFFLREKTLCSVVVIWRFNMNEWEYIVGRESDKQLEIVAWQQRL